MSADVTIDQGVNLQEMLRKLESWQADSACVGQRRFHRYPVRGLAQLSPGAPSCADSPAVSVHIRDISRGGIGVLSSQPARNGQHWLVQVTDDRVTLTTQPGFCRYCRAVSEGAYLIGIEFGVEASILLATGVAAADLALGDRNEHRTTGTPASSDDFVDPAAIAA
jgi:hypothetical protein